MPSTLFDTEPKIRPIREHRFGEYEAMFAEMTKNPN